MDSFTATQIFEGIEPGNRLEALASLIASGLVWQLQGFYGRAADAAIRSGQISPSGKILIDSDGD